MNHGRISKIIRTVDRLSFGAVPWLCRRARVVFGLCTAALFCSPAAQAQIGPDLRPPGLDPDFPLTHYSSDLKHASDQLRQGWDLNASDIVFSAAKKRQLISEAPSTIHIITDRDIAIHGWRSIAEVLRHVAGVQTLTTQSQFQ